MHGDVILVGLEGSIKCLPIGDDINSDEEVSRPEIIRLEE